MRKLDIDESRVLALYEEYETARAVAEIIGCSDETVYRVLRKHDVPRTHRHQTACKKSMPTGCKTKYCNALVVLLRRHTNMTFTEIVKHTGYPSSIVGNIINRRCPETKIVRTRKEDVDLQQVAHEYVDLGMTTYELGEKYGVGHTAIGRWMRSIGIHKGKPTSVPQSGNGKGAAILKERSRQRIIAKLKEDGDVLELVEFGDKLTLRCKKCGHEFKKGKGGYSHCFTCPSCNEGGDRPSRDTAREYLRRMRVPATPDTYDPSVTLGAVYDKYHGICCRCGRKTYRMKRASPKQATLDHVIALDNNGTHTWGNVQLLCQPCNSSKSNRGQMRLAI